MTSPATVSWVAAFRCQLAISGPPPANCVKQGKRIGLQEQPFRLSVILLEHSGEVVTRAEIQSRIWEENTFVDFDSSLRVAVGKLRSLLTGSLEILTLSSKLRLDVTMPWNRGGQVQVKSCAAPSANRPPTSAHHATQ